MPAKCIEERRYSMDNGLEMTNKLDILQKIQQGEITPEKGLELLEALSEIEQSAERNEEETTKDDEAASKERFSSKPFPDNAEMQNMEAGLITCRLNVERSNVEEVTVELYDDATRELVSQPEWLDIREEGGWIRIKENRMNSFSDIFSFVTSENKMTPVFINVKLPIQCVLATAKLSTVSGGITLIGVNAIELEAKSVSGKVSAMDSKIKHLKMKSISGTVIAESIKSSRLQLGSTSGKLRASGEFRNIEGKTVSGGIACVGTDDVEKIKLSSVSGGISVEVPTPENYNLAFDTVSGKIEPSGFARVEKKEARRSVSVQGRSETRMIQIGTVSGKITLDRKE
jgi:DUF4097 and DUF4098 domain-containing protein YvlB